MEFKINNSKIVYNIEKLPFVWHYATKIKPISGAAFEYPYFHKHNQHLWAAILNLEIISYGFLEFFFKSFLIDDKFNLLLMFKNIENPYLILDYDDNIIIKNKLKNSNSTEEELLFCCEYVNPDGELIVNLVERKRLDLIEKIFSNNFICQDNIDVITKIFENINHEMKMKQCKTESSDKINNFDLEKCETKSSNTVVFPFKYY